MATDINEWEFTSDVSSWINDAISYNPALPFSEANCEQYVENSRKRRDLTLYGKDKKIVLTGEVKLPYRKDGGSPYNTAVVKDARHKAQKANAEYFFTWNVNEFVLWKLSTDSSKASESGYLRRHVASITKPSHLRHQPVVDSIKKWLASFLNEFADIISGAVDIGSKDLDEQFIDILESALSTPILFSIEELNKQYKETKFEHELNNWMRDDQGWVIRDDTIGIYENLERASKFACYSLLNKLVFHEALLKRYGNSIEKIVVPDHITKGEDLRLHLEGCFEEAKRVTKDYETVFGISHVSIGNRIPFYSDYSVQYWKELIDQIHEFDFSKLDYDVIGSIFERLISPEERHKYGQFYTRVEVVDLINSFSIFSGEEKVLDPACGGGTFLVRAYTRKREIHPGRKHKDLLSEVYGLDISNYAAHLTTINLATRDLIDDENYPRVACSNFFDVRLNNRFMSLPQHIKTKGLGEIQKVDLEMPEFDAIVGNPPYIRQELIPKTSKKRKTPSKGTKEFYRDLVKLEAGAELGARSDIHCYFWPHAASFLKDDGVLAFLTSSQWLDTDYGFKLQKWLLENFEILAVFESVDEPWFVGARVTTAITILRKQSSQSARMSNAVRFVQLRVPIKSILQHDGTMAGAVNVVDSFRDEILKLSQNTITSEYRVRLISQSQLWKEGVSIGQVLKRSNRDGDSDNYLGGKWGVFLRAPDLWFNLVDAYKDLFVPFGNTAKIRFGVKSGKDVFFYPKDCSVKCLDEYEDALEFYKIYGVNRDSVEAGEIKLVLCGEQRGEIRPIESEYLEPEVHSLMEVGEFTVQPGDCGRLILLVKDSKKKLKGTHVLDYIEWGEAQNYHKGATCASRVTEEREWYDLTGHRRGVVFWPKSQQYKHVAPFNEHHLQCNCNLYDVHISSKIDANLVAGVLNSTIVTLSKHQFGRPVGVEGNLKTEVIDVNMMLVPDYSKASKSSAKRIGNAFSKMKNRKAMNFLSEKRLRRMAYLAKGKDAELELLSDECELDMADRRELDDAVLEMLGEKSKERRETLLSEIYEYVGQHYEQTRQMEEKAIANKKTAKRCTPATSLEIGTQIFEEIVKNHSRLLQKYDPDFLDRKKPFDTYELPTAGLANPHKSLLVDHGVEFVKGKKVLKVVELKESSQVPLVILIASAGTRGLIRVPHHKEDCKLLHKRYQQFVARRDETIQALVEARTRDEDMQDKAFDEIRQQIVNWQP
ncbi:N-6 DNA methylase [Pseudodesulfovibrio sp. JC047]|uniref:HsdM family class I SAM-dependent methyltransferase n=1 Tax=Pseudodesulfovibrio sp. JC047 TaxID=2683199 RepID=UPI0013D5B6C5|nr:N-6 DNA methylase [Pseudodesulfovibrio sp. JC047]NDV20379.1 N-6 DNA methylase [Pseudodesulfovibrio sp. JC047]